MGYEKFDSIIAINVFEHVKDDEFGMSELYKMLKKWYINYFGSSKQISLQCNR